MPKPFDVFLSYSSVDQHWARRLKKALERRGLTVWLDQDEIPPGALFVEALEQGLRESKAVALIVSPESLASGWVKEEYSRAVALARSPHAALPLIPILLRDVKELPGFLANRNFVDFRDNDSFDPSVELLVWGITGKKGEIGPDPPKPSRRSGETCVNSIRMEFVWIPAGTFTMGSSDSYQDAIDEAKPAHQVTISKPFYMGKYPVTQGQWEAVMSENPSRFQGDPNRPVEQVSWDDAQSFIRKINEREEAFPCRLPREAEWEYACRAGTRTRYSFGNDAGQLGDHAWYGKNAGGETHPVGQREPNAWGLYDMHGNVWEWVQDRYGKYPSGAVTDPTGPLVGPSRVVRGGSWSCSAQLVRAAVRREERPGVRDGSLGFRCCRDSIAANNVQRWHCQVVDRPS
jgi:formylglycine-generating enzyme required for sulfatase activity